MITSPGSTQARVGGIQNGIFDCPTLELESCNRVFLSQYSLFLESTKRKLDEGSNQKGVQSNAKKYSSRGV